MVQTFHQRILTMAFMLSLVWVLSSVQLTQAKTAESTKPQPFDQACTIHAKEPYRTPYDNTLLLAYGSISCKKSLTDAIQIGVTVQIQQFKNGEWVTIGYTHEIGGSADFTGGFDYWAQGSVPCSVSSPTHYRTIVTGQYRNASGWHDILSSDENDSWISCK